MTINAKNIRLLGLALAVGLALMAIKFIAWYFTNSNAILTDALESIINIVAGVFALFSLVLAAKPRDDNHPYGHGKIEFISAGFEGAMIFLAGVAIIVKAGYNMWFPQPIHSLNLGLLLTIVTGAVNFMLGYALEHRGKRFHSATLQASGKHLQSDAYSSLGLVVGIGSVILSGWKPLDNLIAIAFGFVILITGFRLVRNSVAGIMDEADHLLIDSIVQQLDKARQDNWIDVHNLRVIKYGATLHIDCHLTLPWYFDTRQSHAEVKAFEIAMTRFCQNPVELFIHADPCEPNSCMLCQKQDCPKRQHHFQQRVTWTLDNIRKNQNHAWGNEGEVIQ